MIPVHHRKHYAKNPIRENEYQEFCVRLHKKLAVEQRKIDEERLSQKLWNYIRLEEGEREDLEIYGCRK